MHFEDRRQTVLRAALIARRFKLPTRGLIGGIEQNDSENHPYDVSGDDRGEESSEERAEGGGNLQKHANPNVRIAFLHIGRSRPGGCEGRLFEHSDWHV